MHLSSLFSRLSTFLKDSWQKIVFSIFGFVTLGFCLHYFISNNITSAAATFGISFLSFIYSNLSQFKRFKGLGFEAELWEDKQKEAAALIERLKDVVAIYTKQIVVGNVLRGRWDVAADWKETWDLYAALKKQHDILGQEIDFSDIKDFADDYFLFDLCMKNHTDLSSALLNARESGVEKLNIESGSPIIDMERYQRKTDILNTIHESASDSVDYDVLLKKKNLAKYYIDNYIKCRDLLKSEFDIDVDIELEEMGRLRKLSELYDSRPVVITEELISWSRDKKKWSH